MVTLFSYFKRQGLNSNNYGPVNLLRYSLEMINALTKKGGVNRRSVAGSRARQLKRVNNDL